MFFYAGAALAQPATTPAADGSATVSELVVVGSRGEPRSRLDTVAPVDVISAPMLAHTGTTTELAQTLSNVTPSLDFPRPAITDGTDHVRPVTLRGLAPDQTLVLVNGHRGHIGALINVNGSIGRGSTAFDLNSIPTVTLGSVEILRDGASAQYGSDAIAGVVNLRLREARSGGGLTASVGQTQTGYTTARGRHNAHDGLTYSLAGWQGLPLGADGFLTLSADYSRREPTNRSDYAAASAVNPALGTSPVVLARFGDPDLKSYAAYANAGLPINETWNLYGYIGYQHRDTLAAATARPYNDARNRPTIYPNGFTPIIGTGIDDFNFSGGVRGVLGGWNTDLAIGYGLNKLEYNIHNTINVSNTPVGATTTQTDFYAGQLEYSQWLANLDFNRDFNVGLSDPLNVAFGLEYRSENFQISPGEVNSYVTGPNPGAAGSQGFPGYRPANTTDATRHNWSAYIDLEGHLTHNFQVGVAGRYEDYSDFGTKGTGKISARWDVSDSFAIRGAVQSGFRAPSLQEQFFTYTSTNLTTLPGGGVGLIEAGTFATNNPIAIALGARPLEPETSTNYSIGLVLYQGNWWGGDGSTARVPSFLRPHPKYEEKDSVGMADDYLGYEAKPSEVSRFWMKKALSEVWSEPGHFFYTLWYRLLILVNHEEYSDNYSYAFYRSQAPLFWLLPNFFFIVLLGFAGGAVFLTRGFTEFLLETKREIKDIVRAKLLIALPLLAYTGVLLLTTMNSRYRMPLTPFLILLGASFLVYAKAVLREHQPKKLVLPGAVTLIALAFVVWPLSLFRHLSFADAYHTIGYSYLEQGDYAQAERYFKKVIDEDPEYAWAFKNLALVAMHDHRYSEAENWSSSVQMISPPIPPSKI